MSGRTRAGRGAARARALGRGRRRGTVVDPAVAVDADGAYAVRTPAVEGASYRVATPAGPEPGGDAGASPPGSRSASPCTTACCTSATPAPRRAWWPRSSATRAGTSAGARGAAGRCAAARPCSCSAPGAATCASRCAARADGPALVRSGVVKTWNGRTARDPDAIMPPGGGHHGGGGGRGRLRRARRALVHRPRVHRLVRVHVVAVAHGHLAQRLDAVEPARRRRARGTGGSASSRRWPRARSGAR